MMVEIPVELAFMGTRYHDQFRLANAREACNDIYFNNLPYDSIIRLVWYVFMTIDYIFS
jgi:hypothetical protein